MARWTFRWPTTLDAVALAVEALVVADRRFAVRFGRDDGRDATLLEIVADRAGIVALSAMSASGFCSGSLISESYVWHRRFTRRKLQSNGPASGITRANEFYW
jgi:hypothetical protein